MAYLHDLSKRNVTVGIIILVLIGATRPTFGPVERYLTQEKEVKNRRGLDVSHYQGNINWHEVKESGDVAFAFVKVTEGIGYIDPMSEQNANALRSLNIPFGNYHFFTPEDDGAAQAHFFLKHVSKPLVLSPVLDVEIMQSVTTPELRKKVDIWLAIVEAETGCKPIIYTDLSFWEQNFSTGFERYPLWLAEYQPKLYTPTDLKQWDIWQNSDWGTITGIQGKIDTDELNDDSTTLGDIRC